MVVLNCTKKFAKRLPFEIEETHPESTNKLGSWTVNSFNLGRWPMVMLTNDKTLLTIVVPFKEVRTLHERFIEALDILLHSLTLSSEEIRPELTEMTQVKFTTHTNRSVLGTMNDFVFHVRSFYYHDPELSLDQVWLRLCSTPCAPLDYAYPKDAAIDILAPPPSRLLRIQRN